MSHENSVTVTIDGKHYNIPTVQRGRRMTANQAAKKFKKKKLGALGKKDGFDDLAKAISAARKRSREHSSK